MNNEYNMTQILAAMKVLNINHSVDTISLDVVKRQYYIMALKYHPDKYKNTDTTNSVTFGDINQAYLELNEFITIRNSNINETAPIKTESDKKNNNENNYGLFSSYALYLVKCVISNSNIIPIVTQLVLKYMEVDAIDYASLFSSLTKDDIIEIFTFITEYGNLFGMTPSVIHTIFFSIGKCTGYFFLTPSLNDLLDGNLYNLCVDNQIYLVPLWQSELTFETPKGEITVICLPDLPFYVRIEDNVLIVDWQVSLSEVSWLICNEPHPQIDIKLGGKTFKLPCSLIILKKIQTIVIPNQGILDIDIVVSDDNTLLKRSIDEDNINNFVVDFDVHRNRRNIVINLELIK